VLLFLGLVELYSFELQMLLVAVELVHFTCILDLGDKVGLLICLSVRAKPSRAI
jgi:hypothetical protein